MATHAYYLTDGVSTITLTSSPYIVENYEMRASKTDANGSYKSVVETILLSVTGTSAANAQTNYENLEVLVNEIVRRKNRPNEQKCYIQARLASDSSTWQSRILDIMLEPRDDALFAWGGAIIPCILKFERQYYWEGPDTSVTISNTHGSGTTNITTYQCNDSTHNNYVNIGSNQVTGTLPTPCKLQIKNATGSTQGWRRYFMWVNAFSSPTTFAYTIEGEAETSSALTTSASASSSSGNVGVFTVNTSKTLRYSVTSAMLAATKGKDFRIIVRFPLISGTAWVTANLYSVDVVGGPIAKTREIKMIDDGFNIKDLGSLPLPPGGFSVNWENLILTLEFRSESSATFNIDYIMLASTDSFMQVEQPSLNLGIGDIIIVDSMENQVYDRDSSTSKDYPIFVKLDDELLLFPARAQRLHVLVDGLSDTVLWQTQLTLSYRPRRLTI